MSVSYYNLEQTLKVFQTSLPEILLPFDLPQLADLCKRGEITPVFPYDKYINEGLGNDRELPTYLKELTKSFNGYLTFPKLTDLILQRTKVVTTSTACIYEEIGTVNNKGTFVSLEDYGYDQFEDYSNGHDSYDSGDTNKIKLHNLRFPIEQVKAYIELKHTNELDKSMPTADVATFINPAVESAKSKSNEQLRKELTAANTKIADLERKLAQANARANVPAEADTLQGIAKYNADKAHVISISQALAQYIWSMDTKKAIRTGDMVQQIRHVMHNVAPNLLPDDKAIRVWISGVAPDYAKKGGRTSKDDPNEISLIMKK